MTNKISRKIISEINRHLIESFYIFIYLLYLRCRTRSRGQVMKSCLEYRHTLSTRRYNLNVCIDWFVISVRSSSTGEGVVVLLIRHFFKEVKKLYLTWPCIYLIC